MREDVPILQRRGLQADSQRFASQTRADDGVLSHDARERVSGFDIDAHARTRRIRWLRWCFAFAACTWLVSWAVADALDVAALETYRPGAELHYRVDADRSLDLDALLTEARSDRLPALGTKRPHFGYNAAAVWMYLPVHNRSQRHATWVIELAHPLLGDVQAWVLVPGEAARAFRGGQAVPADHWPLHNRSFAMPLELQPGQHAEVVLRAVSQSSLQMSMTLWSEADFHRSHRNVYLVLGIFYGIVLAVFCYNLVLYAVLRDRNYLHYVVYIASYLLFQLSINGLSFEFLWPQATTWAQLATPTLGGITLIAALVFARDFLELPQRTVWADRALLALIAAFALQIAITLTVGPRLGNITLSALSAIGAAFMFAVGVVCAWRGQAQARIYLFAWLVLLVGVAGYALRALGVLPDMFFTEYGVQIGAVLQLILLSVALGYRMRGIEENAHRAEAEHRAQLEVRVADRTQELNSTLKRLDSSYKHLESKQQLFEALVEAHEAVRDIEDPDEMLDIALRRFAQARPELGMGFLAREPDRPKLLHHICFRNVESALCDPIVEALRGLPVNADAPVPLEQWLPGRRGLLIPARTSLRQLEGFFLVLGVDELQPDELQDCVLFADHIGATLEALLLRLKLVRVANTDVLTDTFNRNYFNTLLAKAIRDKSAYPPIDFAAVMADLNGLKEINDRYGHEAGDQLIQAAARLLQGVCRRSDSIIRWGGDEFLVFCPGTRADEAARLMHRLRTANGQSCRIHLADGSQLELAVDLSFGVASSSEDPAADVIALADARMLEEKASLYRERRKYR